MILCQTANGKKNPDWKKDGEWNSVSYTLVLFKNASLFEQFKSR